jgi:hypothetical protein
MRNIHLSLCLAAVVAGCASSKQAPPESPSVSVTTRSANTAPGTSKRTNIITQEEIRASGVHSALQLVRMLHPNWLSSYSIFIGESLFGGTLNEIDPTDYKEIRFYTPSEAQMKFTAIRGTQGAGVVGGAKAGGAGAGLLSAIQFNKK